MTQLRALPQVTGSPRVYPPRTPGSVLLTFEESAESTSLHYLILSGALPQVTGSLRVYPLQTPGSVLPTFEESVESISLQMPPASVTSSVQEMSAISQPSLVLILASSQKMADPLHSIQLSISSTVVISMVDADLATCDHKALAVNLPSDASELLAVSGHHKELVTTRDPEET